MFGLVIAVIVLLAGIGLSVGFTVNRRARYAEKHESWAERKASYESGNRYTNPPGDEPKAPKAFLLPAYIGIALAVVLLAASCVATVPTGYTGILTTFGKVEDRTIPSGVNLIAPWQKVIKMDNRTQKVQITTSAFSSDIQQVDVQLSEYFEKTAFKFS